MHVTKEHGSRLPLGTFPDYDRVVATLDEEAMHLRREDEENLILNLMRHLGSRLAGIRESRRTAEEWGLS
jgi:hypothetical protein